MDFDVFLFQGSVPDIAFALILFSLPSSYDTLVTALQTRPEDDLTFDYVIGIIINEYRRRRDGRLEGNNFF